MFYWNKHFSFVFVAWNNILENILEKREAQKKIASQ